jgi:hypothetical protein
MRLALFAWAAWRKRLFTTNPKPRRETGQELDRTKSRELTEGEARLAACEAQSQQYDKRYEAAMYMTAALKAGIADLFDRIGCNTPAVRDLLGEEELSEANLMAYLGIIEQRTNEILQVRQRPKPCGAGDVAAGAMSRGSTKRVASALV